MSAQSAVNALIAASKTDPKIDGPVFVQISLQEPAVSKRQDHPILLTLPHKFKKKEDTMTCLVVKDPSSPIAAELATSPTTNTLFDEVIGVGKLRRRIANGRRNDKTSKKAEQFGHTFSLICVQDKVMEPLKETLGLGFYKRSRHLPVPLSIDVGTCKTPESQQKLKLTVRAIAQSAQLILKPDSKLSSVRVGHTRMDAKKLADNVAALIKLCKQRIPGGLGGSAVFYLKTADSLALKVE